MSNGRAKQFSGTGVHASQLRTPLRNRQQRKFDISFLQLPFPPFYRLSALSDMQKLNAGMKHTYEKTQRFHIQKRLPVSRAHFDQ
jgi:hypothetical protein